MNYNILLDLVTDLGYRLAMSGAETFRIEESVSLILQAYHVDAEVFAIPNSIIVSIKTEQTEPMTRMRRIGYHSNDLDSVELYSNLSRRICAETPEPAEAAQWLKEADNKKRRYPLWIYLIGNYLAGFGFGIFFGCRFTEALIAGFCGLIVGSVGVLMDRLKVNAFFRIIIASFFMALLAYFLNIQGLADNSDAIIIGALMILVPGLLFTNAMRDIIYGDTNSGVNRIVQVFLIAVAIALGTGAAWGVINSLFHAPSSIFGYENALWVQLIGCAIGSLGFCILFNIYGPGILLCMLGGILTWTAYTVVVRYLGGEFAAYFWATFIAAVYAEIMARVRKYPAISYLVLSLFPLIPGAGVYYTMSYAIQGDMAAFSNSGMHTIAIAGIMAVGMLIVSTLFRVWSTYRRNHITKGLRK